VQWLTALIDKLRELLLENTSGFLALAGDVARELPNIFGMSGARADAWNHHYLDRARDDFFLGTVRHKVEIEAMARLQVAISNCLPRILEEAMRHDQQTALWLGRWILETLQAIVLASRDTIGYSLVEATRCTKDASR
jgi:hypothetical protein